MRLLITGSRTWENRASIQTAMLLAMLPARVRGEEITVVHGACPSGADQIADWLACNVFHVAVERHPANWKIDKRAGFVRNAEMVKAGVDMCLAFIRDGSRGASMTADLAERAGIETRRFTA